VHAGAVLAAAVCLGLAGAGSVTAQEPVAAAPLGPFEVVFQRIQICANAVLWRDPSRTEGQAPEVLPDPLAGAMGNDMDSAFYRAFAEQAPDGTQASILWLRALEPSDGGATHVSCEVMLWPLSQDERLQMVQQVVAILRGPFTVLSDWEQVTPASTRNGLRATGRMTVCSGRDRPLRLFVTFDETGYPERVRFGDETLLQREGTCAP
jgi:hypothetical protein